MAIATCNIKVNGRWVRAGETYEPETVQAAMPVKAAEPEAEAPKEEPKEEPKAAPRARSTSRRKK